MDALNGSQLQFLTVESLGEIFSINTRAQGQLYRDSDLTRPRMTVGQALILCKSTSDDFHGQ